MTCPLAQFIQEEVTKNGWGGKVGLDVEGLATYLSREVVARDSPLSMDDFVLDMKNAFQNCITFIEQVMGKKARFGFEPQCLRALSSHLFRWAPKGPTAVSGIPAFPVSAAQVRDEAEKVDEASLAKEAKKKADAAKKASEKKELMKAMTDRFESSNNAPIIQWYTDQKAKDLDSKPGKGRRQVISSIWPKRFWQARSQAPWNGKELDVKTLTPEALNLAVNVWYHNNQFLATR